MRGARALLSVALLGTWAVPALAPDAAHAQLMIIGIDEKYTFDKDNKPIFRPPGGDMVSIVDIGTNPESPAILANVRLMNSIFGPPTNVAITPNGSLAIVANSMKWIREGAAWKPVPDNKLYVIDLTMSPPAPIGTIEVGKQPSGLAINSRGDLALVANRKDNSISVLSIQGKNVELMDTVPLYEHVAGVVFTPDGQRALAVKYVDHKIAVLDVKGRKVTYTKYEMPVGLRPYNIAVTPNGKLALTADYGRGSDGHIDTVSVIDLEADPPRVIDRVVVGDAPGGLAISPTGEIAAVVLLRGSSAPKTSWFYHPNGSVAVLKIDGKRVTKAGEIAVGVRPEGVVFSPNGKYLYVGNFMDRDVSILKVDGTKVTNTGKRLQLPGQPASMRGQAR